jgi:hypothetical protein
VDLELQAQQADSAAATPATPSVSRRTRQPSAHQPLQPAACSATQARAQREASAEVQLVDLAARTMLRAQDLVQHQQVRQDDGSREENVRCMRDFTRQKL